MIPSALVINGCTRRASLGDFLRSLLQIGSALQIRQLSLINPQTGQKNEHTLSLEAHWFLRVILNEVLKDPGNDFFKFERGTYDPLWFRFTSTFVGSVTRPDFSAEFLIYRDSFS
ncbi:hypothetical protein IMZ48_30390 [Candidatus Bathyarchaeota archaeon]|nr:hypothetical protein [Candidatus Bathyarchaeota archaeon]